MTAYLWHLAERLANWTLDRVADRYANPSQRFHHPPTHSDATHHVAYIHGRREP